MRAAENLIRKNGLHPAKLGLLAFEIYGFVVAGSSAADGAAVYPDCLYVNPPVPNAARSEVTVPCSPDPLHLAGQPLIVNTLRVFGVSPDQVEFQGCKNAYTETAEPRPHHYLITYDVVDGEVTTDYLAPLIHELGHVYQLEDAGSIFALRRNLLQSVQRIELGADFLAGIAYQENKENSDLGGFERNLLIHGSYRSLDHGNPEDRSAAFRQGYYFRLENGDLKKAVATFQNDGYGAIVRQ